MKVTFRAALEFSLLAEKKIICGKFLVTHLYDSRSKHYKKCQMAADWKKEMSTTH